MEPAGLRFPGPKKIAFELSARLIDLEEGGSSQSCPHCDSELNLHQPDESFPDQLLATCDVCFRWYSLIDIGGEGTEVLMIEFPSKTMLEEAFLREELDQQ